MNLIVSTTLVCVSTTPRGWPVEPDVYCRKHRSSGRAGWSGGGGARGVARALRAEPAVGHHLVEQREVLRVRRQRRAAPHDVRERRCSLRVQTHSWLLSSVAEVSWSRPSRRYTSRTVSPGRRARIALRSASKPSTATPSTRTSTSPSRSPARAAALPGITCANRAPSLPCPSPPTPRKAPPAFWPPPRVRAGAVTFASPG